MIMMPKKVHMLTFTLLLIGGLNWGLEAFDYGIGNWLSADVAMIIYVLIGLSALYEIFSHKQNCCCCNPQMCNKSM